METAVQHLARAGPFLPNFPPEVLQQWFYEHWSYIDRFAWLDFPSLAFTRETWNTNRLLACGAEQHKIVLIYQRGFESKNPGPRFSFSFVRLDAKLISIRQDAASLARVEPVDLAIVADVRLAAADLIAAVKSMATESRLKQIAEARASRTHEYTKQRAELRQTIAASAGNGPAIRRERLAMELEAGLEKDTIYVSDCDSGKAMDPLMSFGGADKTYIATGPNILGWAVSAAFGAKLARPDRPVVAILGDGAMMFGGPQPLWSMARYSAPVTTIVYNNRSYNNERNRIWTYGGGAQFKQGRDMTCYNGDPDVDFAKAAQAFGVEGEVVKESQQIKGALERAKRANVEGRPYLLDIHVERDGVGAATAWHPGYSIAAKRTRRV